ncbi:hypothetical protein pb186bvf_020200 [Paramecium bursaria]
MQFNKRLLADLSEEKTKYIQDGRSEVYFEQINNEVVFSIKPYYGQYAHQKFEGIIVFDEYPYRPPQVFMKSLQQHLNIHPKERKLYVKLLDDSEWKPTYSLYEIIINIRDTIIYQDITYVPNNQSSLIQIVRNGDKEYSTDEEGEIMDIEYDPNFIFNFELEGLIQPRRGELDEDTVSEKEDDDSSIPQTLDLQKRNTRRIDINDMIIKTK